MMEYGQGIRTMAYTYDSNKIKERTYVCSIYNIFSDIIFCNQKMIIPKFVITYKTYMTSTILHHKLIYYNLNIMTWYKMYLKSTEIVLTTILQIYMKQIDLHTMNLFNWLIMVYKIIICFKLVLLKIFHLHVYPVHVYYFSMTYCHICTSVYDRKIIFLQICIHISNMCIQSHQCTDYDVSYFLIIIIRLFEVCTSIVMYDRSVYIIISYVKFMTYLRCCMLQLLTCYNLMIYYILYLDIVDTLYHTHASEYAIIPSYIVTLTKMSKITIYKWLL